MARQPKTRGTTTEAELRELCAQGLNFPKIAERLNLNLNSVRIACSVLGIRSPDRRGGARNEQDRLNEIKRLRGWVARPSAA